MQEEEEEEGERGMEQFFVLLHARASFVVNDDPRVIHVRVVYRLRAA